MAKRDIVAIGGSSGGIEAAKSLLRRLPADFPAAVLLVIHVGAEGQDLLAGILAADCQLRVSTGLDGERVEPGRVYVAPADHHLLVIDGTVRLGRGPRENLTRPAIDPLFRSVAIAYGPRAVGVILSGFLDDGAAGLAAIARCGGVTAIQSPSDAAAPDMPTSALQANEVGYRASADGLADVLVELVSQAVDPAFAAPEDLKLEVGIALGRPTDSAMTSAIGGLAALSCPACGGTLSQMRVRHPLSFRCQVGHGFTAKVLAHEQEGAVDEAIRMALRIIGERVVLLEKMAAEASQRGRRLTARDYNAKAADLRLRADTLRQAAMNAESERPSQQLPPGGTEPDYTRP